MKRTVGTLTAALVAAAFLSGSALAADKPAGKVPDGKPVFEKYKCGSCHSIEKQGIVKKAAEGAEAAEAGASKAPDLSGVGVERSAAWISGFLLKKEKIGTKLHMKKFRGTEEELARVSGWLASLKDEAAAKKMKAETEGKSEAKPEAKSGK